MDVRLTRKSLGVVARLAKKGNTRHSNFIMSISRECMSRLSAFLLLAGARSDRAETTERFDKSDQAEKSEK